MNDKLTSKHMEMSSSETPLQKDVQGYNIDRSKKTTSPEVSDGED